MSETATTKYPTCPRHGGPWGSDPTCPVCTDAEGCVRPMTIGRGRTAPANAEWVENEHLEYDPMHALAAAGYRYHYHYDACGMVFSKGSTPGYVDGDAYMTGSPVNSSNGCAGVNLSLHDSFYNETLVKDHATAESFVAAFTKTFDRLWAEYDED